MKNGKFSRQTKRRFHNRNILVLISVLLVCVCMTGITLAYLTDKPAGLVNTFEPSQVTSTVTETFPDPYNTKSNVKITNTGNIPAYIRAAVVFTWRDGEGNIAPEKPVAGEDYQISWNTGSGKNWFQSGDYYYYSDVVPANTSTEENLINSISNAQTKTINGTVYYLSVEILSSAIQADPERAVESAWPAVEVENKTLVKAN